MMHTNKSAKAATNAVTLLKNHLQHEGEEFVQKKRHVFDQVSGVVANITQDSMPNQHSVFFSNLPYFAIATVDLKGRPWSTIVVGSPNTVVLATAPDTLSISALLSSGDPVVKCIEQAERETFQFFAGLGVDFSNRRRNKVGGYISDWRYEKSGTSTQLDLTVVTNDNLGNCPKYITVRDLSLKERRAEVIVNSPRFDESDQEEPNSSLLTDDEKSVINQASTLFIATRHFSHDTDSDMGLNHRGGPPGFARVYEENGQTYVVIPDYSGNRFYQSLGNVESDRVAGIVFPRFTNGDILHITGEAENLYDDETEEIMPRVSLLTRIRVTGHVFIKGGMNLEMKGPEQYSPYNPQVRLLKRELEERGKTLHNASQHNFATLVSIEKLSRLISRFTFKLDEPVSYIPGSYAVFDFTDHIKKSYKHMNNANPKSVNDDLIRTWTISSSPPVDSLTGQFLPSDTLSCTIKHVEKGAVTPFLHSQVVGEKPSSLRLRLSGIGMSFSCFSQPRNIVPEKMLWIAGGVGITPFLSMWSGIVSRELNVDIAVLYSARGDESEITSMFKDHPLIKHYSVFDSTNLKEVMSGNYSAYNRRVSKIDIDSCDDLHERVVYICGPVSFMNDVSLWLQQTGVPAENINRESFDF